MLDLAAVRATAFLFGVHASQNYWYVIGLMMLIALVDRYQVHRVVRSRRG